MSWAGCDRLAHIAASLGLDDRAADWRRRAARIRESVLEGAWNPRINAFTSSYGGSDLDATTLLLPELGFVAPDDPRFLATLDAIERQCAPATGAHRHVDDFGHPDTAFTICVSGTCRRSRRSAGAMRRASALTGCWRDERGWVSCPRTSTRNRSFPGAIFRRPAAGGDVSPCA
jgi:GH15 family glucan-1,4-alpha-glucosidase